MKPLHVAGILVVIVMVCIVGYVFTADMMKPQEENYRVGLVVNLEDSFDSFTMQIAEGVYKLRTSEGITTKRLVEKDVENVQMDVVLLSREYETDLIVTGGYVVFDIMNEFAREHPNQNILTVDNDYSTTEQPKNIANIVFRSNEASYVAGYIAGMTTESGIIGFVGGVENEIVVSFNEGFIAGVEKAAKERGMKIQVLTEYVGSFSNEYSAYETAIDMYEKGADIIFAAAGASGFGVIDAADELGKYAIGSDVDQSYLAPNAVIFSVVKDIPLAIHDTVLKYKAGENFGGETISLGYSDGEYVGVTGFLEGVVSDEVIDKAKEIEQDIAEGKITVPGGE